ncbi:hypothetical protein EVAR_28839_1 [Eumeta japonica]|uniref:Uncharacterized protein n=1 Tax=Eumeta variegata TaxID=151549 RepID=A0A4C1WKH0_EUMVA|nr:hypothetical protein EVAR_28839_1 [Eumeta japonica]
MLADIRAGSASICSISSDGFIEDNIDDECKYKNGNESRSVVLQYQRCKCEWEGVVNAQLASLCIPPPSRRSIIPR